MESVFQIWSKITAPLLNQYKKYVQLTIHVHLSIWYPPLSMWSPVKLSTVTRHPFVRVVGAQGQSIEPQGISSHRPTFSRGASPTAEIAHDKKKNPIRHSEIAHMTTHHVKTQKPKNPKANPKKPKNSTWEQKEPHYALRNCTHYHTPRGNVLTMVSNSATHFSFQAKHAFILTFIPDDTQITTPKWLKNIPKLRCLTSKLAWKRRGCEHTWHSHLCLGRWDSLAFTNAYTSSPHEGQHPFRATKLPALKPSNDLAAPP